MKNLSPIIIAALFLLITVSPVIADLPDVGVHLHEMDSFEVYGDSIDANDLHNCTYEWQLGIIVNTPDVVTGPHIEFTSDDYIEEIEPPTSFSAPYTYIWDYPNKSLSPDRLLFINAEKDAAPAKLDFSGTRSVDIPVLIDNVTDQTVDFTLRFKEPITGRNNIGVRIRTLHWYDVAVEQTPLSQNDVPGWSKNDDWWSIDPTDVAIDTDYHFQAVIRCSKRPGYEGTTVFHKPGIDLLMSDFQGLPDEVSTSTFITHPQGETALVQLNETVRWNRHTASNEVNLHLGNVSVPVDNSGPVVEDIWMYYGKEYDGDGTYTGCGFEVEVACKNIVSARMITPPGPNSRIWYMEIDTDVADMDDAELCFGDGRMTPEELAALGIVPGTYQYVFEDHLGETITTSVDMVFTTPAQVPNITSPTHRDQDTALDLYITWDAVWDPNVNAPLLYLENDHYDWWDEEFEDISPSVMSQIVTGLPPQIGIDCELIFANIQSGVNQDPNQEDIAWTTANFTLHNIQFSTGQDPAVLDPNRIFVDASALAGNNNGTNWANAFICLQDALSYAYNNDFIEEIWVASGTYRPDEGGSQTPGDRSARFELIDGVDIYGGFPSGGGSWNDRDPDVYETILSGDLNGDDVDVNDPCDLLNEPTRAENSYHVVTGSDTNETAVLDGFTITAGNADGPSDASRGGGMYNNGSSPTVVNCTFSKSSAADVGGGMSNHNNSSPTVTNCTFIGNSSAYDGGGMDNENSIATVTNCTFSDNWAEDGGGGMCNADNSSPTVTNCAFSGNSASAAGGGMLNMVGSDPNVTNCTFSGNSSTYDGGGMCNYYYSSPTVTNCTFTGNSAISLDANVAGGGGMCNVEYSSPTVTNCILWGNTSPQNGVQIYNDSNSLPTVTYSDVEGGYSGTGNINTDPCFVDADNPDPNLRDYHLWPGSPCIDAGDNNAVPPDTADLDGDGNTTEPTPWDLDGNPRVIGDRIDMGAYEFIAGIIDVNNGGFEYFEDGSQILCHMAAGYPHGGSRFLKGMIDDVRIYDRALSPEEIAAIAGVDSNLIGHWKFDDSDTPLIAENSGSFGESHDGYLMPACPNCPVWTMDAYDGNALEFDGVDDYVEIPALNLYTDTVTISAWLKRDGEQSSTYTGIVISRDGSSTAGLSFGKGIDLDDINHELAYNWNNDPNGWDWHSELIVPDSLWTFVAVVIEPTQATLYLSDGETIDSATNVLDHDIEEFDGITCVGSDPHGWPRPDLMGWTSSGGWVGADVDCNAPGVCEDCRDPVAPDGGIAYGCMQSNDTYLYQILDHNITLGRRYTLTFDALGAAMPWGSGIELIPSFFYVDANNNHVEIDSNTISLNPPGDPCEFWAEWMYDLAVDFVSIPGADYIGEKLGIEFFSPIPADLETDKWTFIDTVRLDYVSTVETGSISGMVTDYLDNPVEARILGVMRIPEGSGEEISGFSETDGTYLITDVPVGTWSLRCTFEGMSKPEDLAIQFAEGVTVSLDLTTTVDFTLPVGGRLAGRLTNAEGNPIANATVWVYDGVEDRYWFSTSTDSNGYYNFFDNFGNLPTGTEIYEIEVDPPPGSPYVGRNVTGISILENETTIVNTTLTTSPLLGTWGFQELLHWNDGRWDTSSNRITVNGDGTGTLIYELNENGSISSGTENFTYTTESNPDGTITIWYTAEGETEAEPTRVVLSADEKVMLVDGTIDPNKQESSVLVKIDTTKTYTNADLSGEYYTIYYDYSLEEVDDYNYGGNSGIMTFDGLGSIPSINETSNRDGTISTQSWGPDTYDVNADGSFVWSDVAGTGYLTGDGKVWILPNSEATDYWGNYTAIKKGDRTYSTADLEGTWAVAGFGDEDGTSFNAEFGYMIFDANGNYSYNFTNQRDGTFTTETGTGTFSVSADGSFGESVTPGAPYYAGAIGNDGNIIIFNVSFDESSLYHREVFIGVRVPAPELVLWYRFDDSDTPLIAENSGSFGSSHDGYLMPACPNCPAWVTGYLGDYALEFDGVDDYVEIPALNLYTDTVTISAWIKRDGIQAATYTGIVMSRDSNSIAGLSFGKGVDLDDINHELAYNWNDNPNGWDWHSGLIIPDNEWVFVAVVIEPEQATLYLSDGETIDSATNVLDHDVEEFDGATLIGRDTHLENRYFRGTIDDVRIYNRALSVGEIAGITGVDLATAWNPRPIDEAKGVPKDVVLSWKPGLWAADVNGHNVYFGNDFNSVNNRDASIYKGNQDSNSYALPGDLEFGETYYWAIDEVNAPNTWPGNVWSFTVQNIYYVDANATGANDGSSWDDAFIDLQDALTVAQDGDHIRVAQGTYTPSQLTDPNDLRTATFELIDGVAIYGGFPSGGGAWGDRDPDVYETILSGDLDGNDVEVLDPCDLLTEPTRAENSYHVVTGNGTGARTVLDGFTITGGNATGESNNRGGGMYNYYSSPTVTNCIFSGNSAASKGGGMYNEQSSSKVTNCIFSGNSADYKGGGMSNYYSSPTVTNCIFSSNSAASKGGGMYNEYSSPTVTDCNFTGNSAYQGGGMHTDWMSPTVTNCTFIGNSASGGGGMNNNVSNTRVTNCTFIGNSGIDGGGMHNNNYYTPIITNCTFTGNSATHGGGMWNNESKAIVTNCIFWNDTPDEIYNNKDTSTAIFTYSDVQGGWPGTGNIDADPLFVDPLGGDCHLTSSSPCIDAADNNAVPPDTADLDGDSNTTEPTPWDLDSHPRFIDDPNTADTGNGTAPIVDMGAYEYIFGIFVDDDAEGDPGPGDPNISDPEENGSWEHPFDAIQEAIDAAVNGDTVIVLDGTYTGSGNRDIDFSGKAITVRSTDPNDPNIVASTVIDCNGTEIAPHRGFNFRSGEGPNSVLAGLTITNGYGPNEQTEEGPNSVGGAIFNYDSSPTLTNCTFTGNSVAVDGGGMCNYYNSSPTVTNCTFSGNETADEGGAMFNSDSSPTVTDCVFTGNFAGDDGGGMYNNDGSSPTVTNCTFSGNEATNCGGGMFNSPGSPTLTNCTFIGNMADEGGGMYSDGGNLTLTNCTFIGNMADWGGGMFNYNSSSTLTNCTFSDNEAEDGGGIYNEDSNSILTDCVFTGNFAGDDGGGMYNDSNSSPTVTNCTFIGNSVSDNGGGMYNCYSGNDSVLTNCTFSDNEAKDGGGIYNEDSNLVLTDSTFSRNLADRGGGMYNDSSPTVANCIFNGNRATGGTYSSGGGMFNESSSPTVNNCTFSGNSAIGGAYSYGGGMYNYQSSSPTLNNCILWGNVDSGRTDQSAQINGGGTPVINYSCVQGWTGGFGGTGNISSNPLLTPDGHLWSGSSCIDSGDPNGDYTGQTDIDGEDRVMNGRVEIGADEFADTDGDGLPDAWEVKYFGTNIAADPGEDPDGDGLTNLQEYKEYSSNPNAPPCYVPAEYTTIQEAIDAASDGDTVLVAPGTYTGPGNRDLDFGGKSIILRATSGAALTIIDCEGSGRGFYFHSGETSATAVIGFTITNGQADNGGAIRCEQSHPQIRDCLITDNAATNQGNNIHCSLSVPTLADCNIYGDSNPNIADIWMEYGGAWIVGTVHITDSNWVGNNLTLTGDGTLQIDAATTLNLRDSFILCNLSGPVTIEVDIESELTIEGDAIINLADPEDPNIKGEIVCDGPLQVKDNVQIINANIKITRATFEDNVNISNNVITIDSRAPYGQVFFEPNASATYNYIYADGDRYMDLDPSVFTGAFQNNQIFVTITEGVGQAQGGLFELRGKDGLVSHSCEPNEFLCQVAPGTIPECNVTTWTIERLELIEGAKLTLTNRFGFQPPYEPGGEDEVLYVKELVLRENSIFNTAFNRVYYETLIIEPGAVITDEPLLGFSLINIALDDEIEFIVRVMHNNFIDYGPDSWYYSRIHIERVEANEPDPNGMMRMRNLVNRSTGEVVNARAKGLFSKANENKVLILFEYLFETSDPSTELVVYLSDVPELLAHSDPNREDHYLEVGRLRPPPAGRYGSVGNDHFGIFRRIVPAGDLNFIRGVRMELELVGPEGTCILINNWDPSISGCTVACGDVTGDHLVNARDFMFVLGEYGKLSGNDDCGIFSNDGYTNMKDLLGGDWADYLVGKGISTLCFGCSGGFGVPIVPCGSKTSSSSMALAPKTTSVPLPPTAGLDGFEGTLLIAGKRYNFAETDFLSDRLYDFDEDCNFISGPYAMERDRLNSKLVRDHEGELYQLNLEEGLVRLSDQNSIIPRNQSFSVDSEPRNGGPATIYVGLQGELENTWGRPILDAAFDSQGYVYVTPVVVKPDVNAPYVASAKLRLEPNDTPPYHVVEIYDDHVPNDNQDPNNSLREIEVDDQGRVYIINNCYDNNGDLLRVYDSNGQVIKKCELQNLGIFAPIGLCCSSYDNSRLYLASSRNDPNASSVSLHVLSTENLSLVQTIDVNSMGHITDTTEDSTTGTLWAVGFYEPNYMSTLPGLPDMPRFYKPYLAVVPYDSNTAEAVSLSDSDPNNDLALPMSIVWTGTVVPEEKCGGADLDESGNVSFPDFAILASWYRLDSDCAGSNNCDGADLEPEDIPDGDVDIKDVAVFALHWLETGCTGH